jgi:hypothetical protein
VYDCHAVHTTHHARRDLDLRWRYTLSSGLAHTWKWYRDQGLVDRPVDFSFEDRVLAELGG